MSRPGAGARILRAELPVVAALAAASIAVERLLPVVIAGAGVFWLLRFVTTGRVSARTPADWPLAMLVLLLPVTVWASAVPEVTRTEVLRLASGVALYYAVVNGAAAVGGSRGVAWALAAAAGALAAVAPLGMNAEAGGLSLAPEAISSRAAAVFAGAVNPNVLAGVLVALWPAAVALPLFAWARLRRAERALAVAAAVLALGVLVLARSRGGLMGAGAAALVLITLRWRRGWAVLPAAGLASAGLAWRLGPARVVAELAPAGVLGGADVRAEIWSRALYMLQDFPFTGIGMGTFRHVANLLYPFFLAGPDAEIPHAHNLFLQVGVDLGLGGLVAWLAVFGLVTLAGWQVYRRGRRRGMAWQAGVGAGIVACQAAIAVHGLTDAAIWGTRPGVLVWGLWGLAMVALAETEPEQR